MDIGGGGWEGLAGFFVVDVTPRPCDVSRLFLFFFFDEGKGEMSLGQMRPSRH